MSRLDHRRRLLFMLAGGLWAAAASTGMLQLLRYESIAGPTGAPPPEWPADSRIARNRNRAQLVMFAHPRCPCTRASLRELEQVMTVCQGLADASVLFLKPHHVGQEGAGQEWEKTDLWRSASEIPGVRVQADEDGQERERFRVQTSGHVLLYDAAGKLAFSGGITPSRGHSGENAGRTIIAQLLRDERPPRSNTLVFGCPLGNRPMP